MTQNHKTININPNPVYINLPSKMAVPLPERSFCITINRMETKTFCNLVDEYGIDRVARMRGISRNQVTKRYLNERDGVERKRKPRKPKPVRSTSR